MNMKRVLNFLLISLIGLVLINITLIGAYIVIQKYGSVTLNPGEKYTINIPFIGPSKSPLICGKAETTTGIALQGVNVSVYYNNSLINKSTTNLSGGYCVSLPEITSSRKYDIFIEYNNETNGGIKLASNDYTLNFDDGRIFSKSSDVYAFLSGTIDNEDAEIDNGRVEVNLKYYPSNSSERYEIFDYQKYFVNINPGEVYDVPSDELNVSWLIPSDAKIGRYKFYIKPSFNAREKTAVNIYFNITA